ncbi:hypothetical protein QQS21_003595 [Conoideocrella luteorostrata]|uniref:Cytochrome P450 n=1 Tax=Conoideocrella luteorostrata TaxID=1105319 RepID=A0AAJ0CSY0_9HYPO|nr:hypothetical protein QQS21_003595 [Conoideocrella luteorostrata]
MSYYSVKLPTASGFDDVDTQRSWWTVATCSIFMLLTLHMLTQKHSAKLSAPTAGYRSIFEPSWLLRMRFFTQSRGIIEDGYQKLKKSTSSMFKIRRIDGDIFVISNAYLEELRYLPEETLSATSAYAKNFYGRYTSIDAIHMSDHLSTQALVHKLTPMLAQMLPIMKEELDFAFKKEIPSCEGKWAEAKVYEIVLNCVSRVSARAFVGLKAGRDERWLAISREFTEHFFTTAMILRGLPWLLHPVIVLLLPSYWRLHSNIKTAKQVISPIVRERRAAEAAGAPGYEKSQDLLQLMMDAPVAFDGSPEMLAHRQIFLSLAAIHTTSVVATNALLDLCAHQEYIPRLRTEIQNALAEDGGGWQKSIMAKLHLLDRCMKESLRRSPPTQLAFNRVVHQPIKLSSGITLPTSTHIAMPLVSLMHDPANVPGDPLAFDPFRFGDRSDETSRRVSKSFTQTDKTDLNFGYGKHACPGKYFANTEIKLILSNLLLEYDFKYPDGKTRPENTSVDEFLFPDPTTSLLIRRREESTGKK